MNVENAIKSIDGVKDAEADVSSGKVRIEGDKINEEKVAEAVKGVGYEYLGE